MAGTATVRLGDGQTPGARELAEGRGLCDRLLALGLRSFPRTTGGKGLHFVVPLERRHSWDDAKGFAGALARAMASDSPGRYTVTLAKAARRGRMFVGYLRNAPNATPVASYRLRGRPGAPMAMPLDWEEVTPRLEPAAFTVLTVPDLVRRRSYPWAELPGLQQTLPGRSNARPAA